MNQILSIYIFLLCFSINLNGQPEYGMPSEPGKCYAKCLASENTQLDTSFYMYVVLAENIEIPSKYFNEETFELRIKNENWIRAYVNNEVDPIWELSEEIDPIKTIRYLTEKGIRNLDEGLLDTIYVEVESTFAGTTTWQEVICETAISNNLLKNLESELVDRGYSVQNSSSFSVYNNRIALSTSLREALVQYQRDEGLWIGQLTIETIKNLGLIDVLGNKER